MKNTDTTISADRTQFSGQMSAAVRDALLNTQTECTFIWGKQDGSGAGTIMSYLWRDDCLWLTTNDAAARIRAVERTGKGAAVISSAGTSLGHTRCVSMHGVCHVHRGTAIPGWFYPAISAQLFPDNTIAAENMRKMLDRKGQVVLQLIPEHMQCYDGQALMQRAAQAQDHKQ
jgi:hypothetical protein